MLGDIHKSFGGFPKMVTPTTSSGVFPLKILIPPFNPQQSLRFLDLFAWGQRVEGNSTGSMAFFLFCKIPVGWICSFFFGGETGGEFDYHFNYVMYLVIKWWVSELIQQLYNSFIAWLLIFYSRIQFSIKFSNHCSSCSGRRDSRWVAEHPSQHCCTGGDILGVSGILWS